MPKIKKRIINANMPEAMRKKVQLLLNEFQDLVEEKCSRMKLERTQVRGRPPCSLTAFLDERNLFIVGGREVGTTCFSYFHCPGEHLSWEEVLNSIPWSFDLLETFGISLPALMLDQSKEERRASLEKVALDYINAEVQRKSSVAAGFIQMDPIFGVAPFLVDDRLAFLLMSFDKRLDSIYKSVVKPSVESLGLTCRRADELKTSKTIMLDIWEAICEARIVIADLTGLNPNVMYELGISHTVGKDTILMYQKLGGGVEFPFDLSHIRRIEYLDTDDGKRKLGYHLREVIIGILSPPIISLN